MYFLSVTRSPICGKGGAGSVKRYGVRLSVPAWATAAGLAVGRRYRLLHGAQQGAVVSNVLLLFFVVDLSQTL